MLDEGLAALRELVQFSGGAIQLIEDDALVAVATDPEMSDEAREVRIPVGEGVSGTIAATGDPIYIPDITVDPRVPEEVRRRGVSGGVRSYFGLPLIVSGSPIGVLQIDSLDEDAFDADDRALVLAFAPTIAAGVQNAWLFDQERTIKERVLEADRVKENFLAIVSHELRTPLTLTLGFTSTVLDNFDRFSQAEIRDLIQRAHRAGRRLERLIEDLTHASRLERGVAEVEVAEVDVAALLTTLRDEHEVRPREVAVVVDDPLPAVRADPVRLRQVLDNLIENAEKYSPADALVRVVAAAVDDEVHVSVEDRGPGIPPGRRDEIFDLFSQAEDHPTRSAGGLGIGLYVVRRLTEAMGGRVEVSGRPGGGTRFTVALVAADGDDGPDQ